MSRGAAVERQHSGRPARTRPKSRRHPVEEQVLWRLEGQLESTLLETLGPNYKVAVEAARKEVRGSQE
jgi:hypothetical protein